MTAAGPTPDEPLDFETPSPPSGGTVTCAACKQPVAGEYWTVDEAVLCGACKATVERSRQVPAGVASRAGRLGRATVLGLGGMLAGAAVWYAVAKLANLEVGLIAILLGWLVGKAVFRGSGYRGGRRYQVLAVALTYVGIGISYTPFAFAEMQRGWTADSTAFARDSQAAARPLADSASDSVAVETAPSADTTAVTAAAATGKGTSVLVGLVALLALVAALPVLVVVTSLPGSLISALIYGFALHQAWQMTGAREIAFGGPFRVGGTPGG